ncbi:MAG: hypothetical protein ACJA0Z_004392 [Halioglobus sp.]|jgi:hypothetical protein
MRLAKLLNNIGVYPIPLKGICLLLTDVYDDIGERVISDIDILINPADIPRTLNVLRQEGYVQRSNPFFGSKGNLHDEYEDIDMSDFRHKTSSQNHHLPPIKESRAAEFNIEIHHRLCRQVDASINRFAFQRNTLCRTAHGSYLRPTDSFTLLHTAHHMLVQDNMRFLGLTDYRHLRDADCLLARIHENDNEDSLLKFVSACKFANELTFLLWQCEYYLKSKHIGQLRPNSEVTNWIAEFKNVNRSNSRRKIRVGILRTKVFLTKLIKRQTLVHAFGDMPYKEALPLYLCYQYRRASFWIKTRNK